jgi:predicted NBD/HSP70 family sugar kinase
MGINMLDMKQSNARTVLWTLCSCKTSTIKDMTLMTGLSFATVGNILNSFVESGEVILGEMYSSTGGRPSQAYTFNSEFAHVLALSAKVQNGKNIITACIGNLYQEEVWKTAQSFENFQLTSFETMIDLCLHEYPTIRIISFSLPGVERNGIILTNDYKELEGIDFLAHFQKKYKMPIITENDVNAAVLGYSKKLPSVPVIVGIYFPKQFNPGAGIMIDGKVLKGFCGYAGEVGLLPIDINWPSIDYKNTQEVGAAISKLISIFCGIINPDHVVLYGDFFTDALADVIGSELPFPAIRTIFPSVDFQSDLDADIITGLIALAVSSYQTGLSDKL